MNLNLRELTATDKEAFLKGAQAWPTKDRHWHSFEWKEGTDFSQHLEVLRKNRLGQDLPEGWVPSTMLYGFVEGVIIGRLHVRHFLTPSLQKRGGNIGYAVAPGFRQKGYAGEMLRQALPLCKNLGLNRVLITCDECNIASHRVIEKNRGILQEKLFDEVDQVMIRKYIILV